MQDYGGYRINAPAGNPGILSHAKDNTLPQLRVAPLKKGTLEDLEIGDQHVFAEYDTEGKILFFYGLKDHLIIQWKDTSIAIIDNHNHALYQRYRAYHEGIIAKGIPLIHLDQHSDARQNPYHIVDENLHAIEFFSNHYTQVGNFIAPAIQSGLIGSVSNILSEYQLLNTQIPEGAYLLDIDCDFWDPRMSIQYPEKTFKITRELIQHAQFTTIATSPYFMSQEGAIALIKELLDPEY